MVTNASLASVAVTATYTDGSVNPLACFVTYPDGRRHLEFYIDQVCLFIILLFIPVLFCFVLFCFVLFCFVLFCFVLFCFVLFSFPFILGLFCCLIVYVFRTGYLGALSSGSRKCVARLGIEWSIYRLT